MLFWLACEDLKKEISKAVIEEKARLIYEDYISILSPKEVRACIFSTNQRVSFHNCHVTQFHTQDEICEICQYSGAKLKGVGILEMGGHFGDWGTNLMCVPPSVPPTCFRTCL